MNGYARLNIRPDRLAILLWLCYVGFVLLRLAAHGWDPSVFVCAGTPGCDPSETPTALHVNTNGASYDGEFYYRIALAPANLQATAYGINLGRTAYRFQRIGYPLVCWLFSLGHPGWLSVVMIGVNLFWLAVLMVVGMRWCRDLGVSEGWGLLPLLWPGLLMTLGRDLTEIQAATLLVTGAWLMAKGWPGVAVLALSGAALTRETTILPMAGFGVYWCVRACRERTGFCWRQATWLLVPAAVLLAWHGYLRGHLGAWPISNVPHEPSPVHLPPFEGAWRFIADGMPFLSLNLSSVTTLLPSDGVEGLYQLFSMLSYGLCLTVPLLSCLALRSSSAPMLVKIAWALLILLFFTQSQANWAFGPSAFMRVGNDVMAFGLLIVAWNGADLKRRTACLMACGWLAAWPYCIMMP